MVVSAIALCVISYADAAVVTYTYDEAGRLIKADFGDSSVISYTYDNAGNLLKREAAGGSNVKGDVNGDKEVDLRDLVTVLKFLVGFDAAVNPNADANGDGKIGLAEGIYALRLAAGL